MVDYLSKFRLPMHFYDGEISSFSDRLSQACYLASGITCCYFSLQIIKGLNVNRGRLEEG
jgi:hypothetical protein